MDPGLIRAIVRVESGYDPNAVSSKGAMGLMQLIPATAQRFGVANPFDPKQNLEGGVNLLKYLMDLFGGNLSLCHSRHTTPVSTPCSALEASGDPRNSKLRAQNHQYLPDRGCAGASKGHNQGAAHDSHHPLRRCLRGGAFHQCGIGGMLRAMGCSGTKSDFGGG